MAQNEYKKEGQNLKIFDWSWEHCNKMLQKKGDLYAYTLSINFYSYRTPGFFFFIYHVANDAPWKIWKYGIPNINEQERHCQDQLNNVEGEHWLLCCCFLIYWHSQIKRKKFSVFCIKRTNAMCFAAINSNELPKFKGMRYLKKMDVVIPILSFSDHDQ